LCQWQLTNNKSNFNLDDASERGIIELGGENVINTGASGAIPRDDFNRMEQHAAQYYEAVRKMVGDVENIAVNTGFSIDSIKIVKQHIFFNAYDLGENEIRRFDPNYDMAVSWQRLIEGGNIREMDIVLLKHELMEYELMQKGMSYVEAHTITVQKYNYQQYVNELNRRGGLE
jgi:hypothetical protein